MAEIAAKKEHEMQHEGAITDLRRDYSQHRLLAYALLLSPTLLQALDKELAVDKAKKEEQDAILTALKQQKTERIVAIVASLKEATATTEAAAAEATKAPKVALEGPLRSLHGAPEACTGTYAQWKWAVQQPMAS